MAAGPHLGVEAHYTVDDLAGRVLSALTDAGADLDHLTVEDLAPLDAFHIRGRQATEELLALVDIVADHQVLDVGCGIGGTTRYIADKIGCHVVGVDLTASFCAVAEMLSRRVGLSERNTYYQASAVRLPFEDGRFDVVWTEHVQMNIADKSSFYGEMARVLRRGGQLAFHDIFAGPCSDLCFPVPWAGEASISHLVTTESLRAILEAAGLAVGYWQDMTAESIAFFEQRLAEARSDPRGLHVLMGHAARTKFENLLLNLREDRLRVIQAVLIHAE